MNWWWKTKGTQGQFTIDRRTIALDTDELLFWITKEEKIAKENVNSEMKIWKINCWRGTFGNVMLGRWMNQTISEEFIEKTKHWPINLSISQVPLDQLCFVECYERLLISRLFKTESSKDEFKSSQDLSEEETFKTITSKMRLPLRFQANLGLINLFNQDFIKTLYITRLLFYSRSRKSNHNTIGINKETD